MPARPHCATAAACPALARPGRPVRDRPAPGAPASAWAVWVAADRGPVLGSRSLPLLFGRRRWRPPGDDPRALAGLRVVGDQREVPLELDDARQLAALVIGVADGFSSGFVHDEHAASRWHGGSRKEGAGAGDRVIGGSAHNSLNPSKWAGAATPTSPGSGPSRRCHRDTAPASALSGQPRRWVPEAARSWPGTAG